MMLTMIRPREYIFTILVYIRKILKSNEWFSIMTENP